MTDPIADFLTRIRNAIMAAPRPDQIPSSKMKVEMARILKEQGYIEGSRSRPPPSTRDDLTVAPQVRRQPTSGALRPQAHQRARASAYVVAKQDIPSVLGGMGTTIMSTSGES